MIIDSHHHFWKYDPVEYDWIDEKMKKIRKDFLPGNLEEEIHKSGVNGVVTVQARQCIEETKWLLKMASENDYIKGVVGWLPIANDDFKCHLEQFASHEKLVAIRHVIQGESNENFILGEQFNKGISLLKEYDMVYDILIFERHLPQTIEFVKNHPNQVFVMDHIAKPLIAKNELLPWRENIHKLAQFNNVFCKMSGMITEADFTNWTENQLQPYFDTVIEAFGSDRLMFGSDWPVCLVGVEYKQWFELVKKQVSKLSTDEQNSILGKNAIKAYKLKI